MAALIRSIDWAATDLGPPAQWPQPLRWTLRLMLDARQPMALWWGPQRVALYNDAFRALLGDDSHPALLGTPAQQSRTPVGASMAAEIEQVFAGQGAVWRESVPVQLGQDRPMRWSYGMSPLSDGAAVQGALLTCMDVTRSPPEPAEGLAAYASVIEAMDEGFCIIEVLYDAQGEAQDFRFLETNPAFTQQCGLDGVLGRRGSEVLPRSVPEFLEAYSRTARTGQRQRITCLASSLGRWFDLCTMRVGPPGENKVAVLFRDVSVQHRLGEALADSKALAIEAARRVEAERQRLAAVLQAVPVGLYVADAAGDIQPFNAQALLEWTGRPADAPDGSPGWTGWWPAGAPRAGEPLQPGDWPLARALAGEEEPRLLVEIAPARPQAERRTYLITAAPMRDQDGNVTGAVATSLDMTERVRVEAALQESDRRKDNFLAMLAHELRNPLAPIRTVAELLQAPQPAPDVVRRCGEIIARQVTHLVGLVNDINDISRVTRGLIELDRAEVEVQQVVADAVEQVRPLIEARRHELHVRPAGQPVLLHADAKRLVQVLSNLLTNAARYTPEGGQITVRVEVGDSTAHLCVEDTGIGMSPDFIRQAFQLFVQARRSSDRYEGGLGIGLAMVRKLVELHGGTVEASSPGEGLGSCFTVHLPCLPRPQAAAEDGVGTAAGRPKVLIVDDNIDTAQSLGLLVEAFGYHPLVTYGPDDALYVASREAPQTCIVDIGLPHMDGHELARRLRGHPQTRHALLIAMSGSDGQRKREAAGAAVFDHYFAKPVDFPALRTVLGGRRAHPPRLN